MLFAPHAGVLTWPRAKVASDLDSERPEAEALLLAVAQRRDRVAYARFFGWYAPRVKGQLLAAGASAATADELVQEVMLRVWRKAEQFDPARGAVGTWLYAMTRNTWINHTRGRHPGESILEDAEVDESMPARDDVDPEASARDAEWRTALRGALASLPAEQIDVLRGACFSGHSLREVADETKVPLGTVKTRVRLALERLRGMLKSRWDQ